MRSFLLAWLVACVGDAPTDGASGVATDADTDTDTDTDSDSDSDSDSDADADSDADTGSTSNAWCADNPDVVAFTASAGLISANVELSVTLDAPAPVVARCVLDSDPNMIFFAESLKEVEAHTLRLMGLLPSAAYTCTAAPDCLGRVQSPAQTPYVADAPPSSLRPLSVVVDPVLGMTGAFTMAAYTLNPFGGDMFIVTWGPDGRPRHWFQLPSGLIIDIEALYDPVLNEIVWGGGENPEGRVRVVDLWDGETYAFSPASWQNTLFHHDAKRLDDGRLITLETRRNQAGNKNWDGFGVRVHDQLTGVIDIDIDSQRYVDEGILRVAEGGFFDADPYHANWMDLKETTTGPELYISLCFDHTIIAVEPASGDVLWHLGEGKGWTVKDASGAVIGESFLPQCQHGLEVIGERRFLVYDNGQNRGVSSAAEWSLDPSTLTATLEWSWTEPGWSEDFLGDIDLLDGDRVLLTQATFLGPSHIVEVDRATGNVASRMSFMSGGITYRSERYDGCTLFNDITVCDATAARHSEVEAILTP